MHRKLKHFGSTLCPPPLSLPVGNTLEEPCAKEHEVVAQLLVEDDLGKTLFLSFLVTQSIEMLLLFCSVLASMRLVYKCMKDNEVCASPRVRA